MADDYSADPGTIGILPAGGSAKGSIETPQGDIDWFKVTLVAGTNYLFSLKGNKQSTAGSFYGTLDTFSYPALVSLKLYDAAGQQLGDAVYDQDNGPIMSYTAPLSGDFFLAVSAFSASGTYTVGAAVQPPDDIPGNSSTTAVLTLDTPFLAKFEMQGDQDWVKIYMEAGKFYSITYQKPSADSVYPTGFAMFDPHGKDVSDSFNEPLETGFYYIKLQGDQIGPYSITAKYQTDDYSRNVATTGVIAPGAPVTARIDYRYDEDYFRIVLTKGVPVTIALTGDPADVEGLSMNLVDGAGQYVSTSSTMAGGARFLTVTPDSSGNFYLSVDSEYLYRASTRQPYTLSIVTDDHGDKAASATPVALGAVTAGAINRPGDVDFVSLQLQAGVLYGFEAMYAKSDSVQMGLSLTLPDGTVVTPNWNNRDKMSFVPELSGTYALGIAGSGNAPLPLAYTVKAAATADDVGSTPSTAAQLTLDTARTASLEPGGGDRDWFGITLGANLAYHFVLQGEYDNAGTLSLYDTVLNVLDASGKVMATYQPGGYNTFPFSFTPTTGGTYYAEVRGSASGTYRVAVMADYYDDVGSTIATAATLQNAVTFKGVHERMSDVDVFRIDVQAGQVYMIKTAAVVAAGSYPYAPTLTVTDGSGAGIQVKTIYHSYGSDNVLQFTAATSGAYYVHAAPQVKGSYGITSTWAGVDDFGDSYATSKPMNGTEVFGTINHYLDVDVLRVNLVKGTTYHFDLIGKPGNGGTLDTSIGVFMTLHASDQPDWSRAQADYPTGHLEYKAETSGEYFVQLTAREHQTGTYTLRMSSSVAGDTTAPLLTSYSHAPGSTTVGLSDSIVIRFSEAVRVVGGITLTDETGKVVPLTYPGGTIDTIASGDSITINPAGTLGAGVKYTLNIEQGAIRDMAGNLYQQSGVYSFTGATSLPPPSDTTAPTLVSGSRASGAANVGLHETLTFTFSEAVSAGGLVLTDETGAMVTLASPIVSGAIVTLNPAAFLLPGATYSVSLAGVKDLAGNSYAAPTPFTFKTVAASSAPSAGNDFLAASGKGMTLAGGAGVDTAVYRNAASAYVVDRADGKTIVTASGAPVGDTLTGIERLMFNGSAVALDIDGTGGQAYRLYQAAFNRTPDQAGVGYWMAMMDKGTTLNQVATGFLDSEEFRKMYGTGLSDKDFVGKLYSNVLHRAQDQAGADFWTGAMAGGVTRAQVLEQFSESAENQAALIAVIGEGFTYIPFA